MFLVLAANKQTSERTKSTVAKSMEFIFLHIYLFRKTLNLSFSLLTPIKVTAAAAVATRKKEWSVVALSSTIAYVQSGIRTYIWIHTTVFYQHRQSDEVVKRSAECNQHALHCTFAANTTIHFLIETQCSLLVMMACNICTAYYAVSFGCTSTMSRLQTQNHLDLNSCYFLCFALFSVM